MKFKLSHTAAAIAIGTVLCALAAPMAAAQTDWSNYDVILYDAETIARINAPRQTVPAPAPVPTPALAPTIVPAPAIIQRPAPPVQPAINQAPIAPSPVVNTAPPQITAEPQSTPQPQSSGRDISQYIARYNHKNVPIIEKAPDCTATELAIRVNISGIKHQKGSVVLDLHNDVPEDFLKSSKVLLRIRHPVTAKELSVCMPMKAPGQYALGLYHDKNNNEKFDKNFLGIPKERFGASNNPRFGLSKPELSTAIFEVSPQGADVSIHLLASSDILNR